MQREEQRTDDEPEQEKDRTGGAGGRWQQSRQVCQAAGLASYKVYSNVIFHYITEAGTQQLQPHCSPGTYTQCHSSSSCHIRKNTADTQAFKSHFINNAWVISTSIYLPRLKITIRVLAKDTYWNLAFVIVSCIESIAWFESIWRFGKTCFYHMWTLNVCNGCICWFSSFLTCKHRNNVIMGVINYKQNLQRNLL